METWGRVRILSSYKKLLKNLDVWGGGIQICLNCITQKGFMTETPLLILVKISITPPPLFDTALLS